MVEKPERFRLGEQPRASIGREWEVFVRGDGNRPVRHVGSITASTADLAYEQATKLFAWYATDVWLCPADAVHRYSTHELDTEAEPVAPATGVEERSYDE